MLDGHGDDVHDSPINIVANFSSNVWYGGCSPALVDHLHKSLAKVNGYPEVSASSLSYTIECQNKLQKGSVLVTNGAVEAIYLIAHRFTGFSTSIVLPSFAEYEDACRLYGHSLHFIPIESLCEEFHFETEVVFFCNPNNPTGHCFSSGMIERWISNAPNTFFVVDEAYMGFTREDTSCLHLVEKYLHLIIIRSMTKWFSIPGLRLGYMVAQPSVIQSILPYKMPWSVNSMALEAGDFIMTYLPDFTLPVHELLSEAKRFATALAQLSEIEVMPSCTNFFLCRLKGGKATDLKQYLLTFHGILIRDASNFRGLTEGHFRLAALERAKNDLLLSALKQWISRQSY